MAVSRASRTVVLLQAAVGDYRQSFLQQLNRELGEGFRVLAGDAHFEALTKTRIENRAPLVSVRNHYLAGRRFLWQSGCWRNVLAADIAILELNPRILSVWLLLLLRRMLGKPNILWGHASARRGPNPVSNRIRQVMWNLSNAIIVYTDSEARALQKRMPRRPVVAAPNALYSEHDIAVADGCHDPLDFIFVGRFSRDKKPTLLVRAFLSVADVLPAEARLIMVGDGPLQSELTELVRRHGQDRVLFPGHVADRRELRLLYAGALASVSPGFVGLSLTQSLCFGVPMIIAKDEPHAPEIEAAVEGWNCVYFGGEENLSRSLLDMYRSRGQWVARRGLIAEECSRRYSTERMVAGFLEAIGRV